MVCERNGRSSHTFRLLKKRQSERIPRCLRAAVRGPLTQYGPRTGQQGQVKCSGAGTDPKAIVKIARSWLSTGYSQLWKMYRYGFFTK